MVKDTLLEDWVFEKLDDTGLKKWFHLTDKLGGMEGPFDTKEEAQASLIEHMKTWK